VIYGYMSGASIAKLFIAGIIPGILLSMLFILCIGVWVKADPKAAGGGKIVSWGDKFRSAIKTLPVVALAIFLLMIIYMGVATPAEAAALGCLFALGLCCIYGRFRWKVLFDSCLRTIATSGFLLLLMGTAKVLAFMVSKAGIMYGLQNVLSGMSIVSFIAVLYITDFCAGRRRNRIGPDLVWGDSGSFYRDCHVNSACRHELLHCGGGR
jgi:C4-dicarboxylate transporter DctM subunit